MKNVVIDIKGCSNDGVLTPTETVYQNIETESEAEIRYLMERIELKIRKILKRI